MIKRINVKSKFVYKTKTFAQWQEENPILLKGEIGFVSDVHSKNFLKVGDGVTAWNNLPYKTAEPGENGLDGGYYVPNIEDGVITFEPSKADMPAVENTDLKGTLATKEQLQAVKQTAENAEAIANTKADYDWTKQSLAAIDTKATYAQANVGTTLEIARQAEQIAKGKATGYVFDTVADLDAWLENADNTAKLTQGDNFYIRAVDAPDYWWDGTQKQPLETQKVELSEYVKNDKVNVDAIQNTIPKRDSNASINVSIAIQDENGNNYTGAAVPHTLMDKRFRDTNGWVQNASGTASSAFSLADKANEDITAITNETIPNLEQMLLSKITAKKITYNSLSSIELKPSSLYLLRASGKDVIKIVTEKNGDMKDSDGGDLVPSKTIGSYSGSRLMLLFIPENLHNNDFYGCFAIGVPDSYLNTMAKSFYWRPNTDGKISAVTTDNSYMMIWEVKL